MSFTMMIGPSGSGKSYFAERIEKQVENSIIVSSDLIRFELFGDENCQKNPQDVFDLAHKRILSYLELGKNVIFDATNLRRKHRAIILQKIPEKYRKTAVIVVADEAACLEKINARERKVPSEVVHRQFVSFEMPCEWEGFDEINYIQNADLIEVKDIIEKMKGFDQCNHNHSMDLYDHSNMALKSLCKTCDKDYTKGKYVDQNVILAAMYHDIGKMYTKTFTDIKGNETAEAHYYGHNNYGAYLSLLVKEWTVATYEGVEVSAIKIAQYIQWHMLPYFLKTNKAIFKWRKRMGEKFFEKIMLIHEADEAAH